jgi:hypothetical protein
MEKVQKPSMCAVHHRQNPIKSTNPDLFSCFADGTYMLYKLCAEIYSADFSSHEISNHVSVLCPHQNFVWLVTHR